MGVVKIKLTDGEVLAAAAVKAKGGCEQFNGREGETATLYERSLVNSELRGGGFAPRHLNRYTVQFHLEKSFEDWSKNPTRWEHPNESRDGRILFENFLKLALKHGKK